MKILLGFVVFFLFIFWTVAAPLNNAIGEFVIILTVILAIVIIVKFINVQEESNFSETETEKQANELEKIRISKIAQQKQKEKEFKKEFSVNQIIYFSKPYVNIDNRYSRKEFYEKETKDSITRKSCVFIRKYYENLDKVNKIIAIMSKNKFASPRYVSMMEYYPLELNKLEIYPLIIINYLFDNAHQIKHDNDLTLKWNKMLKYHSQLYTRPEEATWQEYRKVYDVMSLGRIIDKYDRAVKVDNWSKEWNKEKDEKRRKVERMREKDSLKKQHEYNLKNSKVGELIEISNKNKLTSGCKFPGVYIIVNNKTLDFYIGESQNLEFRMKTHFGDLVLNTHHRSMMQKHFNESGKSVFDFYVLEKTHMDDSTGTARKRIEEFYINKYHPTYNLA